MNDLNTFKAACIVLVRECANNNTMSIIVTHRILGGAADKVPEDIYNDDDPYSWVVAKNDAKRKELLAKYLIIKSNEASANDPVLGMGTYRYFNSAIGGEQVRTILANMKKQGQINPRLA
jgi:hypothetical protein